MNQLIKLNRQTKNASPLSLILLLIVSLAVFTAAIHTSLNGTNFGADFYTFWVAGNAIFEEGISPYDAKVTHRSQMGIYQSEAGPSDDQMAFAYPLYSLLVILPTVFLSFDWAMSFWLALNLVLLLLVLIFLARKKNRWESITTLLLYPIFFGLVMGNFTIIVGSCILFFYGTLVSQKKTGLSVQVLAGAMLAFSTIKPQFAWLLVGFALLFAVREKWIPFLTTFFLTILLFFTGSFLILPGWFGQWLVRLQEYSRYIDLDPVIIQLAQPLLPADMANAFGWSVTALLLAALAYLLLRWWQGKTSWMMVLSWIGMTTFFIHPHGSSQEQIAALIPLILWIGIGTQDGKSPSWVRFAFWIAAIVISWLPMVINSGAYTVAVDRSPILLIIIWVAWLMIRECRARLSILPAASTTA